MFCGLWLYQGVLSVTEAVTEAAHFIRDCSIVGARRAVPMCRVNRAFYSGSVLFFPKILIFLSLFLFSSPVFAKNGPKNNLLQDLWPRVSSTAIDNNFLAATTDAGLRLFKCSEKCRETDRFQTPDAVSTVCFMTHRNLLIGGGMGLWYLQITSKAKLKPLWQKSTKGAIKDLLVTSKLVVAAMGAIGIALYRRQGSSLVLQRIYPTGDYCRSIAIRGNILYAACGYDGLLVIDVENPSRPVIQAHKRFADAVHNVQISSNMAFVALERAGAAIISIKNPTNPQVVGRAKVQDGARATAVFGHYLYVADGMKGIGIFDISNPRHPVDKGHLNTKGAPVRVQIRGSRLIVANDYAGVAIYDLSTPEQPKPVWRTGHLP